MPYRLKFKKPVAISDPEKYINDCCIGGDLVLAQLLPGLRERFQDIRSDQEDWGWFAWVDQPGVKLAVDVFTEEVEAGEFIMHLTSRKPRLLLAAKIEDLPELEVLREQVVSDLKAWPVEDLSVELVDERYFAVGDNR